MLGLKIFPTEYPLDTASEGDEKLLKFEFFLSGFRDPAFTGKLLSQIYSTGGLMSAEHTEQKVPILVEPLRPLLSYLGPFSGSSNEWSVYMQMADGKYNHIFSLYHPEQIE